MKTKFTPLVRFKKREVDKCEQHLQECSLNYKNAQLKVEREHDVLYQLSVPKDGSILEYQSFQMIVGSQRHIIQEAREWVAFAKEQLEKAKKTLQEATIEYEKYKYLESEEIKKLVKELQKKESRDLDEVALQTFMNRRLSS